MGFVRVQEICIVQQCFLSSFTTTPSLSSEHNTDSVQLPGKRAHTLLYHIHWLQDATFYAWNLKSEHATSNDECFLQSLPHATEHLFIMTSTKHHKTFTSHKKGEREAEK